MNRKLSAVIVLLLSAAFYFHCLPISVQTGDTGELIANALRLGVPHPPGYPLFLWINHFWINAFPFGPIFFRAAFLQSIFSAIAIALLFLIASPATENFEKTNQGLKFLLCIGMAFTAATLSSFWKYAVLPDVFSLHALFLAALTYLYFLSSKNARMAAPFFAIFVLGLANHQTILFLLPMALDLAWAHRKNKQIWLAIASSVLVVAALYLSLLLCDNNLPSSWGNLHTSNDVFAHFLRRDYGTLRLSAQNGGQGVFYLLQSFFTKLILEAWPFLVLSGLIIAKRKTTKKLLRNEVMILASILLYIAVFFPLANISPGGTHTEIIERFLLMPLWLTLLFVAVIYANSPNLSKNNLYIANFIFMLTTFTNFAANQDFNNFSKNTILEDYAINLLMETKDEPAILLAQTDSEYSAFLYVQSALEQASSTLVVVPQLLKEPWYRERLSRRSPKFVFADSGEKDIFLWKELISPNILNYSFFLPRRIGLSNPVHTTFLPLGVKLTAGDGFSFDDTPRPNLIIRSTTDALPDPQSYDVYRDFFSRYAHYYLRQGMDYYAKENVEQALQSFETALKLVPYATPALQNICSVLQKNNRDSSACEQKVSLVKNAYFNYFLEPVPK